MPMKTITHITEKVLDYGKKAVRVTNAVIRHAASGFKNVSEEQFQDRLTICRSCEFLDPAPMQCKNKGCGCFLNVKARMETMHCPIGKW